MVELVLPFIGNITIWPYVVAAIAILLIWDHIPDIVKSLGVLVWNLLKKLLGKVGSAAVKATDKVIDVVDDKPKDEALAALQKLAEVAVHDFSPEALAKVVGLYPEVQKQIREVK